MLNKSPLYEKTERKIHMNKNFSRILALTSAFCFALCSCSETKNNSPSTQNDASQSDQVSAQTLTELSENSYKLVKYKTLDNIGYLYNVIKTTNGDYLAYSDHDGDEPCILKINSDFSDTQLLKLELPEEVEQADEQCNFVTYNSDGCAAVYYTFYDNGDMSAPEEYDENFDYDAFYANQKESYAICFYNSDGSIKKFIDLGDIGEEEDNGYSDYTFPANSELPDSDTYIGLFRSDEIYIFRSDGSKDKISIPSEYTQYCEPQLLTGSDGKAYLRTVVFNNDHTATETQLLGVDTDTMAITEPVFTENGNYGMSAPHDFAAGYGDYLFMGTSENDVIGVKADGTSETILKWIDADTTAMGIVPAENDEFFCYTYTSSHGEKTNSVEVYKLVHREAGELDNVQLITMASFGTNPLNYYISKFNREQDKYRIQTIDYSSELTPEEMEDKSPQAIADRYKDDINRLKIDIAAGKCPDILMLDASDTALLGKKGALLDLYTLMDKDSEINRDTVVPNILRAMESSDGKLYSITPSFTVNTIAAKKKFVDHENWTLQEMIDLYDSKDTAVHRYDRMTKQDIFRYLICSDNKLVDIENSECHFDTPEFIELLNFCNRFVDDMEFADKGNNEEYMNYCMGLANGRKDESELISIIHLCGDRDLALDKFDFGEDISLVGYPTSNGKGGKIIPNYEFSIGARSSVKEGAWEFIKLMLNEASDQSFDAGKGDLSNGYSVLMKEFDKQIDGMSKVYIYDENGDLTESTTFTANGMPIELLSKDELADLRRYILSCDTFLNTIDDDAYAICMEEADEYFKGGKSAEEAAKMMQNRISLIVSEKS
jgi:ABC-type glycerol-3-phosphate transport system substrate-binding protein